MKIRNNFIYNSVTKKNTCDFNKRSVRLVYWKDGKDDLNKWNSIWSSWISNSSQMIHWFNAIAIKIPAGFLQNLEVDPKIHMQIKGNASSQNSHDKQGSGKTAFSDYKSYCDADILFLPEFSACPSALQISDTWL